MAISARLERGMIPFILLALFTWSIYGLGHTNGYIEALKEYKSDLIAIRKRAEKLDD